MEFKPEGVIKWRKMRERKTKTDRADIWVIEVSKYSAPHALLLNKYIMHIMSGSHCYLPCSLATDNFPPHQFSRHSCFIVFERQQKNKTAQPLNHSSQSHFSKNSTRSSVMKIWPRRKSWCFYERHKCCNIKQGYFKRVTLCSVCPSGFYKKFMNPYPQQEAL